MSLSLVNPSPDRSVDTRFHSMIQSALDAGGGHFRVADILGSVEQGEMTFHPGQDSCAITQIVDYPGGRTLCFELLAGNLNEIVLIEAFLSARAKAHHGVVKAEIIGRPGWRRVLPDYREIQTHLLKDL